MIDIYQQDDGRADDQQQPAPNLARASAFTSDIDNRRRRERSAAHRQNPHHNHVSARSTACKNS